MIANRNDLGCYPKAKGSVFDISHFPSVSNRLVCVDIKPSNIKRRKAWGGDVDMNSFATR
jgi:hypothetical protein